jgi:C4-dicarboxylate-specific signal transduction histidine kinase
MMQFGMSLALMRGELRRHDVLLATELFPDLGSIMGDRVQVQQVILNLIRNGIEAMSAVMLRPRVLRVSPGPTSWEMLSLRSRIQVWGSIL